MRFFAYCNYERTCAKALFVLAGQASAGVSAAPPSANTPGRNIRFHALVRRASCRYLFFVIKYMTIPAQTITAPTTIQKTGFMPQPPYKRELFLQNGRVRPRAKFFAERLHNSIGAPASRQSQFPFSRERSKRARACANSAGETGFVYPTGLRTLPGNAPRYIHIFPPSALHSVLPVSPGIRRKLGFLRRRSSRPWPIWPPSMARMKAGVRFGG